MRLLVAGGAGYIGSVLIPKLLERGYLVDVVDVFWFGNHLPNEVHILHKDIFHLVASDLEGYDCVIFLAGLSNDPMAEFSPSKNFIFNAAAPAYLAYIAKKARVRRFVYACSCSVYGYTVDQLYDETMPAASSYPYGISKLQGEQAVLMLGNADFSVISLRKGTVSGYSPRMRLDLIVNTMVKSALRDGVITVNNPSIWRPIISINDTASAYIRAIEASSNISGIFNIASGNYTVGEVADLVKLEIDRELEVAIKLNIHNYPDYRNYKVNTDKAANILSFHPQDDVTAIVRHLLAMRNKFDDWDNPAYYNIDKFRHLESSADRPESAAVGASQGLDGALR